MKKSKGKNCSDSFSEEIKDEQIQTEIMDDRLSEDEEDPLYDILPSQSQQIERRQQAWGQQRYEDQEEVEEDKVEVFETNRRQNIVTLNNFPQRHTPDIDPQMSSSIVQRQNGKSMFL